MNHNLRKLRHLATRVEPHLGRFFNSSYVHEREKAAGKMRFQTLNPAIRAYLKYQKAKGRAVPDPDQVDLETDTGAGSQVWKEPVRLPRKKKKKARAVPLPSDDANSLPDKKTAQKHH